MKTFLNSLTVLINLTLWCGLASAQTVLCVILFSACALHVRWRFQMAKANPLPDPSSENSDASEPKA